MLPLPYGTKVRVTNSMLYTGRVGTLKPNSGHPEDFWDYNVELSDRTIGATRDQVEAVVH